MALVAASCLEEPVSFLDPLFRSCSPSPPTMPSEAGSIILSHPGFPARVV